MLSREDLIDLLEYHGIQKIKSRESKNDIQFCCPHGENNPSAGVNVDIVNNDYKKLDTQICNCFSCHFSGTVPAFLHHFFPEDYPTYSSACDFLEDRYDVSYDILSKYKQEKGTFSIGYFDDDDEEEGDEEYRHITEDTTKRVTLPMYKLAPFRSGKSTYQYFFDRGFNKQDMRDFKVGLDQLSKTITVPLFWEDEELAGFIGRYISNNRAHNERYKIYEGLKTGLLFYPLDKFEPKDNGEVILVEGLLDAMWMHKYKFSNTLGLLTNNISNRQIQILKEYDTKCIIDFTDNDNMGELATKALKKACRQNGWEYKSVKDLYPEGAKDPKDCTCEQIESMLSCTHKILRKKLSKYYD